MPSGLQVLYLVRHSKAVGSHPEGDRHRPLSPEGQTRIQTMIPRAESLELRAELALSSPYLRAVQTRDLFAPVVRASQSSTSKAFLPDADPEEALDVLQLWESQGIRRIAVFTHNPLVSLLASWLLASDPALEVEFHTPSIFALQFDHGVTPGRGRLLWTLHP